MWLTSSSIGRKFVMAITGACLVLFVTFHVVMNAVCILWPAAYNQVCMFLGANWYALIASAGLAALFIIHIIYAIWLTVQNRKARGNDRYEVTTRPPQVEWSSKNMLVLGFVILAFLCVHMYQFWAKMQLQELLGTTATIDGGVQAPAEFGTLFIQAAFSCWCTPVIYIIAFIALWFHMNHGFWSMFQTTGWNGKIWLPRLRCIGCWWTSIVIALFVAEAVVFTVKAHDNYYFNDEKLQEQYGEYYSEKVMDTYNEFQAEMQPMQMQAQQGLMNHAEFEAQMNDLLAKYAPIFRAYATSMSVLCKDNHMTSEIAGLADQMESQLAAAAAAQAAPAAAPEDIEEEGAEEEVVIEDNNVQ